MFRPCFHLFLCSLLNLAHGSEVPTAVPVASASTAAADAPSSSLVSTSTPSGLPSLPSHLRSLALSIGTFTLTPEQEAAVEAAFFTDPKALKMHDQSPRFGPSYPVFTTNGEEKKDPYGIGVSAYVWGLVMCFLIGVAIAILQLLCTGFYMFMRCCCWRWCCKQKSEHEKPTFMGYKTFCSKYYTVIALFLFIALACAFSIVGIVYNKNVSKTFSKSDQANGIAPLILNALDGMDNWLSTILNIIDNISGRIPGLKLALAGLTTQVGDLGGATAGLSGQASGFARTFGGQNPSPPDARSVGLFNVTANGTVWFCDVTCVGLGVAANQMAQQISSQVTPVFADYAGTINDVTASFTSVADDINSKLTDASTQLDDSRTIVVKPSTRSKVTDNADNMEKYDGYRNIAFLVLFSLVFLTPALAFLGLLLRRGCPFKLNFCLGPFYMFLIWLLFGTHWMLGMFIGDACVYLDDSMLDLATALASQTTDNTLSSVLNACLTDVRTNKQQ